MQNKLCLKLTRQTFWRFRKLSKENGYDDTFLNQLLDDRESQQKESLVKEKPKKPKSSKKK